MRMAIDGASPAEVPGDTDRVMRAVANCGFDSPEVRRPVADRPEFFGMNAAGDQETVESGSGRTGNVGAQTVADGEDPRPVLDREKAEAGIVNRAKRLAVPAHATARLPVTFPQCPGAEREPAARHDDQIKGGANHRQIAGHRGAEE